MVYYGLTINVWSLGGSVYVNYAISITVELSGYLACFVLRDRVGRRTLHASVMILGGVACLCTIFTVLYADKCKSYDSI
jgi:OCT family organic cation transporter-like MFS transporter 4/5